MIKHTTLLTLCALAAGANAQQRNAIDVVVREPGDTVWHDTLVHQITGSGPVHFEVAVFYDRGGGYGFSGAVHNLVVSNWGPTDSVTLLDRADSTMHPDGRQGRFNFGGQAQQAYTSGADQGTLRLSGAGNPQNDAAGGISVKQRDPSHAGTSFDTSNPAFGFRFDITLDADQVAFTRDYFLETPQSGMSSFTIYQSPNSTFGTEVDPRDIVFDEAVISLVRVPAPGSLAALGLAGLVIARRRR